MALIQNEREAYSTDFMRLCPLWSKVIIENGFMKQQGDLSILDAKKCVVGEAWGFKSRYYTKQRCMICQDMSSRFIEFFLSPRKTARKLISFSLMADRFATHFVKEHPKEAKKHA